MTTTPISTDRLPAVVRDYLAAHTAGDADRALRAFTPDASVADEGRTYSGTAEIDAWLREAGSEFTYTTALVGAERDDSTDDRWVAVQHLEGDFPGGVADLRYRFVLAGDLVAELVVAP